MLALKKWVCGALRFGTPAEDVFNDWSAVALLERAKQGQVVWCGQAAMVFQQACWALGIPARYIECGAYMSAMKLCISQSMWVTS